MRQEDTERRQKSQQKKEMMNERKERKKKKYLKESNKEWKSQVGNVAEDFYLGTFQDQFEVP